MSLHDLLAQLRDFAGQPVLAVMGPHALAAAPYPFVLTVRLLAPGCSSDTRPTSLGCARVKSAQQQLPVKLGSSLIVHLLLRGYSSPKDCCSGRSGII